jgi:predicted ATP-grasp superfamily ATP-dependent carboligase
LLKFDPNVMHHGGLGAIRSLGRMGVEVYAVQETARAPAASSRYLRAKVVWRPGGLPAEQVLAGLGQLSGQIGRPAVLIPTDDAGAIFLAEHGAALRGRFLFADPPPALPRQVAGKYSLHQLCTALGVPSPRALLPATWTEAAGFAADCGYPVIGKLARPWQAAGQQRSTVIIRDRAELGDAWRAAQENAGQHDAAGLMLQEFIPSTPGGDWFFHAYCGADAVCRPACTGVKDRSYPAFAGLTSCGRWMPNGALRAEMMGLLAQLGYRGIADLDLRLDRRDGQYKLLDFNPRLGAQFRLFTDAGGLDVVRAAYLDLTGQPVPGAQASTGRTFVVENYDPLSAVSYWRRGELRPAAWLTSVRGADEVAWFARDDLRPFGLMCARMGWRMLTRPLARGRAPAAAASRPEPRVHRGRAPEAVAGPAGSPRFRPRPTPRSALVLANKEGESRD